jgi:hypothetical protein
MSIGKVLAGLLVAFLATVAAARLAFESTIPADAEPDRAPWTHDRMEFVAWNGEPWTAWIRDGTFQLVPQDSKRWSRHSNPTIAFVDWEGAPWQAKIDGEEFVLARRGDWQEATLRSNAIRYRDWTNSNQLRTAAQLTR